MRRFIFLKALTLVFISVLINSCASPHFITRRYTTGTYRENKHTIKQPSLINTVKTVYASDKKELGVLDLKATNEESQIIFKNITTATDGINTKLNINNQLKKTSKKIQNKTSKQNQIQNKKVKSDNPSNKKIDTAALLGFIFAMAAILFILTALLIIYLNPYFLALFAVLFLLGLILGVTGLIFGTKAKNNHKKNNGTSVDLTFSIIATIVGVLCMIALIASIIILLVALILFLLIFI